MSQVDDVVVPLLSARIFSGLAPFQLKTLALQAETVSFNRGDTIIKAYQEGDGAYLVGSGAVVEEQDESEGEPTTEFGTGTMIGEMAMLVETLHSATVVARTPVKALKFRRESLHALMEKDPALSEHFVDKMRQRLVDTANRLRDVERTFGDPLPQLGHVRALS